MNTEVAINVKPDAWISADQCQKDWIYEVIHMPPKSRASLKYSNVLEYRIICSGSVGVSCGSGDIITIGPENYKLDENGMVRVEICYKRKISYIWDWDPYLDSYYGSY